MNLPENVDRPYRLMIVDDNKNICRTLRMVLEGEGSVREGTQVSVRESGFAEEALRLLGEEPADIILLDIKLPGMDGIEMLGKVRSAFPNTEVILISGHGTIKDAVTGTRLGAYDFLEKPLDRERVLLTVRNCLEKIDLDRRLQDARRAQQEHWELKGSGKAMRELIAEIRKVAPTNGRVLITGESGSGKELVARTIHNWSQRADRRFVKVNCAAIPGELIEAELFGFERGSFTGATARKKGQFELANGGTLFLDEVGDMSLPAQAKVLRVLQTGEITHIGGERTIQVDVRVIAATNKDLKTAIEEGTFREDLYYRLNVVPIQCPPLRDRKEDIPTLCHYFVAEFCRENNFKAKDILPDALERLAAYHWPGNVRELKNVVERMVIMSGDAICLADVPAYISDEGVKTAAPHLQKGTLKQMSQEFERQVIRDHLIEFGWNVKRTAKALGMERTNLHKKIRQLGIRREDGSEP